MSVRVVARVRPLLKLELDRDVIVTAESAGSETVGSPTVVSIPNPKNEQEYFKFQFNSVYDQDATQQQIFDAEVAPTVKHLFNGYDATIFAYGVTGTGKTHTMRGGKSLADRGVIPRLLSSIYRRARKIEKDTAGSTQVEVAMSYYEIYNDKVYDLFEPPEKRTPAGLPIRDNGGKSIVVGLAEKPCGSLKEFEGLYDEANVNRSTSATKLNAHSSRSHAILCVKLTQTTETEVLVSRASCIDLAGSEDNRRTDNNRERLIESASINKSLFVLAQCVEAISKKQSRIPYRESKMTRILALGQNNGLTLMILNLAPVRSYHLDTISSLNVASRTKKIEVCEIENQPISRDVSTKPTAAIASISGSNFERKPLRPLAAAANVNLHEVKKDNDKGAKPIKQFSVYSDRNRPSRPSNTTSAISTTFRRSPKRTAESAATLSQRPTKVTRPSFQPHTAPPSNALSKATIEDLIDKRIAEKLAEKALSDAANVTSGPALSDELQRRLDSLEQRVDKQEDGRSEGLQFLLMAKQHQVRGEEGSALRMYQLAQPFFPGNEKLSRKIEGLQEKIRQKRVQSQEQLPTHAASFSAPLMAPLTAASAAPLRQNTPPEPVLAPVKEQKREKKPTYDDGDDSDWHEPSLPPAAADDSYVSDDGFRFKPKAAKAKSKLPIFADPSEMTPRSQQLLKIINTRDVAKIKGLKGVGVKKAEGIVGALVDMDIDEVNDLEQLGALKGVGWKTVENMRLGLAQ